MRLVPSTRDGRYCHKSLSSMHGQVQSLARIKSELTLGPPVPAVSGMPRTFRAILLTEQWGSAQTCALEQKSDRSGLRWGFDRSSSRAPGHLVATGFSSVLPIDLKRLANTDPVVVVCGK